MNEAMYKELLAKVQESTGCKLFILDDKHQLVEAGADEWAKFMAEGKHVLHAAQYGSCKVMTMFIGTPDKEGNLFATHISMPVFKQTILRYKTWAEADKNHVMLVNEMINKLGEMGITLTRSK